MFLIISEIYLFLYRTHVKYIYRTQDLAKVASFSDSKPQKQHYAKINGLEKLIINTGNEPFH
ncbi:hypothetical protein F3F42_22950 [Bacteroides ovatus]|uniref:Uncharacterized protein n=2 Tax=Bacteroides TaxID=816 RepID=A0A5M6A5Q0_9BACE|nr:hypothetical protein F3F42_22950 [Bacteroides ovatus]KAA3913731.1 hypothetical protein F3D73_23290 [Bacteroides ovatus]KAA5403773.1 hypothetical protein F2Y86_23280 [Bacteroides cellulosilyticus]KAB4450103.1 hypothetical protein GAN75_26780 [Bacteroides thetaiotaomicron]RYU13304.1 hypothetical protein EAJ01_23300 [Bacteroides cellulosilyticus]